MMWSLRNLEKKGKKYYMLDLVLQKTICLPPRLYVGPAITKKYLLCHHKYHKLQTTKVLFSTLTYDCSILQTLNQ